MLARTVTWGAAWLALGCAQAPAKAAPTRASATVTVLEPLWMTGEQPLKVPPKQGVERALASLRGVRVAPSKTPARPEGSACQQDTACIRAVGREAKADKVMVLSLAELGDTVLLKLSVVEARGTNKEQAFQRVSKTAKVEAALAELTREAAKPFTQPEPKREPSWYERWWVWAGAAAVAAGATVVILLTTGDDSPAQHEPDIVITPP